MKYQIHIIRYILDMDKAPFLKYPRYKLMINEKCSLKWYQFLWFFIYFLFFN